MIRRVRIDYRRKHPPGTLVIRADKRGKITYEREKRIETKRKDFDKK